MSDAGPDPDFPARRDAGPDEDAGLSGRLSDLERRLGEHRDARRSAEPEEKPRNQGMALALRLGTDFVAAVIVGIVIGMGIDSLFGIGPWGLVVFLLLGFAAGILSLMRSAGLVRPRDIGADRRPEGQ